MEENLLKNVVKKIMIYSLAGVIQVGLGATVIEASPWHDDLQRIVQLDDRHDDEGRQEQPGYHKHNPQPQQPPQMRPQPQPDPQPQPQPEQPQPQPEPKFQ